MAFEGEQIRHTFVSTGDLSAKQFYFVKLDSTAGKVVVCAATTDVPIGVVQNAPAAGEEAIVCLAGVTKVNSDAALSLGAHVGTSADGQAAAYVAGTDTTKRIVGVVLEASGAAAGYATATINCLATHRGA